MKAVNVYYCPDDPTKASGSNLPISYAMAVDEFPSNNGPLGAQTLTPTVVAQLNAPALSVALFEEQGGLSTLQPGETQSGTASGKAAISGSGGSYATGPLPGVLGSVPATAAPVHTGGANYLLWDGHVKYVTAKQVSPGHNASSPTNPQTNNTYATGTGCMDNSNADSGGTCNHPNTAIITWGYV